jgi:type IV pilus assembly protein PilV
MKPYQSVQRRLAYENQRGMLLIEALCAILIFSFGVLGLIGLQVNAVSQAGDAKLRNAAAQLADAYINQMWVSGHSGAAIQTAFNPSGASYTAWLGDASTAGTVMGTLPGVTASVNTPSVKVACSTTTSVCTVNIVMHWQSPKDTGAHSYATDASVSL